MLKYDIYSRNKYHFSKCEITSSRQNGTHTTRHHSSHGNGRLAHRENIDILAHIAWYESDAYDAYYMMIRAHYLVNTILIRYI